MVLKSTKFNSPLYSLARENLYFAFGLFYEG